MASPHFEKHLFTRIGQVYKCPACPKEKLSFDDMIQHVKLHQNGVKWNCKCTPNVLLSFEKKLEHLHTHDDELKMELGMEKEGASQEAKQFAANDSEGWKVFLKREPAFSCPGYTRFLLVKPNEINFEEDMGALSDDSDTGEIQIRDTDTEEWVGIHFPTQ